jgi:hypothetical protein
MCQSYDLEIETHTETLDVVVEVVEVFEEIHLHPYLINNK